MISTRLAWMAPVPGSMGGHVMTPISDERSFRMWWLPLAVCRAALEDWGSISVHGTLAASEPGQGLGADGRFNDIGLACCHRCCRGPARGGERGQASAPMEGERADRGSYRT